MDDSQRPSIVNLNYHQMLMAHCLANRIGFFPDVVEPWYSVELISHVLGLEAATFQNKKIHTRLRKHPLGAYYRLSEILKYAEEHAEESKSGER